MNTIKNYKNKIEFYNDAGVFLAFENPFDEESNLDDIDQQIKIDNKSTLYKTDLIWNNVLDREFSEL